MRLPVLGCLFALAGAAEAKAQHEVLFAFDADELTWLNGNGLVEVGMLRQDELGRVAPRGGRPYSSVPFLAMAAQWAYLGDADNDGRYADDSTAGPGGDVDAVFVRAADRSRSLAPREVFLSKGSAGGFAAGFEDGDVFRLAGPLGALEIFVTEALLLDAVGQSSTSDLDLDALCQSDAGDLFLSFDMTEQVGGASAEDGALIHIPAAAITYDGAGNVSAIAGGAAVIAATEAQMAALVASSGVKTSVGGDPSVTELTALEIDPEGGTWSAPESGDDLQNLLFGWGGFSNDGAIVSTSGGGTIAQINGIDMGSAVATTGIHLGMLPDSTGLGGLSGLALAAEGPPPVAVEQYPRQLITSLPAFHRIEVASASSFGLVLLLVAVGPASSGGAVPSVTLPTGELFLNPNGSIFVLVSQRADLDGFAHFSLVLEDPSLAGINLVTQVLDLDSGVISLPAALQFL